MPLERAGMLPLPRPPQSPRPPAFLYVPDRSSGFGAEPGNPRSERRPQRDYGPMPQPAPAPQPGQVAPPQTPMPLQRSGMLPP